GAGCACCANAVALASAPHARAATRTAERAIDPMIHSDRPKNGPASYGFNTANATSDGTYVARASALRGPGRFLLIFAPTHDGHAHQDASFMIGLVQRVSHAEVHVDERLVGGIAQGM